MTETVGFNPEAERHSKIESIKNRLVQANFLKPDEKQRDEMSDNLVGIFKDELKHGTSSVADMELTMNDDSKTEPQIKIAKEDREILGQAVFLASRELVANDPSLASEFFLGSKHMENMLPVELKGLGKEISKNYISNEQIDKQLNLLETTRQNVDFSNPSSVEVLVQKIDIRIGKLANEDFDDEQAVEQQDAVLTVLNEEKKKYVPVEKESKDKYKKDIEKDGKKIVKYEDTRNKLANLDWERSENILDYSRELLDTLENSSYKSNDISMGDVTRNLNTVLDKLRLKMGDKEISDEFKDIYSEIDARLALHDSEFYMEDSNFKISDRGGGIGGAIDNIYREKRDLNKERLKFLLHDAGDENKTGLPIDKAWNFMQRANFDYEGLLTEVAISLDYKKDSSDWKNIFDKVGKIGEQYGKGTTVENRNLGYWLDSNDKRKTKVDEYIIKQLTKEKDGKKIDGTKALQLAKKLIGATGERSVFNFALINGDDFAEDIHFGYFRADDGRKGKNVGPMSTMGIKTLTPGWLRTMSKWDTNSGNEVNTMLMAEDILFDKNEGKLTFGYYYAQTLPSKVHALRAAFLDNSPDPKKILASGAAHFNSIVDCFNKVEPPLDLVNTGQGYITVDEAKKRGYGMVKNDKTDGYDVNINGNMVNSEKSREGRNNLRSMYALGLLEMIGTKPSLGWTPDQIMELRKIMVETNLSTAKPFLNENMWDWANKQIVANDGNKNYTFKEVLMYNRKMAMGQSFWKGFLKGISGQK